MSVMFMVILCVVSDTLRAYNQPTLVHLPRIEDLYKDLEFDMIEYCAYYIHHSFL